MEQQWVATFYTHLGALEFYGTMKSLGDHLAEMGPVPRKLSVSCGTGVFFALPFDKAKMMNPDLDAIYKIEPNGVYETVWKNDL